MNLDKQVSLTTAIIICTLSLVVFWSLILIPGLLQAIGFVIYLLVLVAWIAVIVLEIKILQEMSK